MNTLYYGDNLDILRRYIDDESVDLVYLDPPFNSDADYNVLFAEQDGSRSVAQTHAFEDTWHWDEAAARAWQETVEEGGKLAEVLVAMRTFLGASNMLAYLAMMATRVAQLRRVLKRSGSLYLHCDPTASHYLKLLLDAVFGPECFRNEIIWRRTGAHNKLRRFGPIHDVILFYTRSGGAEFKWNNPKRPYMMGHVAEYFEKDDKGYKSAYYGNVLTGSGTRNGESGEPWMGINPTDKGRHWAIPGALKDDAEQAGLSFEGLTQHQKLDLLHQHGYITMQPGDTWPMYSRYLTDRDGQRIQDIWAFQPYTEGTVFGTDAGVDEDVRWLSPRDQERLGYQTQKPEGLLRRIIEASTDEGDTVLDPFCGCGTTVSAAEQLNRQWIGIDITFLATSLIKSRLRDAFGDSVEYETIGEPVDLSGAVALAEQDKYDFQYWALGLVEARPVEQKKGADHGIDGRIYFHDDRESAKTKQVVISVKGGGVGVGDVRDLRGVVEREKAQIGVLICLHQPTKPMTTEAAGAGFYDSPWTRKPHPKIQVLTIEQLLSGEQIDMPPRVDIRTFKKAPKAKRAAKATDKRQKKLDME